MGGEDGGVEVAEDGLERPARVGGEDGGVEVAEDGLERLEKRGVGAAEDLRRVLVMKGLKLGDRDFQLIALLSEARCLSGEQIKRLYFPGSTESVMRLRLKKLCEGERAFLKRVEWYDRTGIKYAWALTTLGYVEAERVTEMEVDVPRDDIGAEYLDHHVLLTELLVGLLAPQVDAAMARLGANFKRWQLGRIYARASHPSFRWSVVENRDLPWKQPSGAKLEARVLRPDALLEIPSRRRRIFIESEMGTHTIASVSASKATSNVAKMERYEAFCTLMSGPGTRRTWYEERFADGMKPEVLFLVRTAVRQASVQKALDDWKRTRPTPVCGFQVATAGDAVAELCPVLGLTPSVDAVKTVGTQNAVGAPQLLSKAEMKAITEYFVAAQADFKQRRDKARTGGFAVPEYPVATTEMHQLVSRLKLAKTSGS